MYFVSVPAAACDTETGINPDNALPNKPKADLKLVETQSPKPDETAPDLEADGSALAARILQLHASSDFLEKSACRPPKLVGDHEDPAMEMPGILKRDDRPRRVSRLEPDPVPQPDLSSPPHQVARSGPSFKALVISSVLAISAVGVGLLMFLPDAPQNAADSRQVETELIAAEPTIESLIDADASAAQSARAVQVQTPSPEQITSAKDRIRRAFAANGTIAPVAATLAQPATTNPRLTDASKVQARLEPAIGLAEPTSSPHQPSTNLPRVASTRVDAIAVPIQAITAPAVETTVEVPSVPEAGAVPASPVPAATDPEASPGLNLDYPNKGTILASVNLRQSEDKDGRILTTIPAGTEVAFDACGTWWCGVSHDGQTGFVGQKFLERSQQAR